MFVENKIIKELIEKVAVLSLMKIVDDKDLCYLSIVDGSYIACSHQAIAADCIFSKFLYFGITEQIQNAQNNSEWSSNIGFNPEKQQWFGWLNNAIAGFGIGSTVKLGDLAYQVKNKDKFLEHIVLYWKAKYDCDDVEGRHEKKGVLGTIEHEEGETISVFKDYPKKYGRGEWTARTLSDAKQMAIDFTDEEAIIELRSKVCLPAKSQT